MACCGLCRPKIKSTIKTKKNITLKTIHRIDMWIENIEGPYESIDLPSKPPDKPIKITNKEEITEMSNDASTEQIFNQYMRNNERQNLEYLSSDLSTSKTNNS